MKVIFVIGIILLLAAVVLLVWALCAASGRTEREWEEKEMKFGKQTVKFEFDPKKFEYKSTEGLKPCPFCGSDNILHRVGVVAATSMFQCLYCGADVCFYGSEHDPRASEAWNRRPEE